MIEALLGFCIAVWIVTVLIARWRIKNLLVLVSFQSTLLDMYQSLWDAVLGNKKHTDNVVPFRRK